METITRLVFGNGAVAGHPHLVKNLGEFIRETRLGLILPPGFEAIQLQLHLEGPVRPDSGVKQRLFEPGLFLVGPKG